MISEHRAIIEKLICRLQSEKLVNEDNAYGLLSRDVTEAMSVSLNKGTATMLLPPTHPLGIELLWQTFSIILAKKPAH